MRPSGSRATASDPSGIFMGSPTGCPPSSRTRRNASCVDATVKQARQCGPAPFRTGWKLAFTLPPFSASIMSSPNASEVQPNTPS
jgi:hypothetical protein